MVEININKLRKDLISIYQRYVEDPHDENNKDKAGELYMPTLVNSGIIDSTLTRAVDFLQELEIGKNVDKNIKTSKEILKELEESKVSRNAR